MQLRLLLAAAITGVSVSSAALAFESYEHRTLVNLAFRIALERFRITSKDPRAHAGVAERLTEDTDGNALSYGRMVACVDYFLYPQKLLIEWRARSVQDYKLDQQRRSVLMRKYRDWNDTAQCYRMGGEFFQATHNNHAHFGNGALTSYRVLHLAAIAAGPGDMHTALVMNAIADHYLQDFLAPGHIFTQRERLSDVYARSRHDDYNYNGAPFIPQVGKELRPIAYLICGKNKEGDPCNLRTDLGLQDLEAPPADINIALQAILDGKSILFRGDDLLWAPNHDQLRQRLFMLLISTQSVLDVLEGKNTFDDQRWEQKSGENHPGTAKVAYGEYDLPASGQAIAIPRVNVVGLSYARESMTSGGRAGRNALSVETALGFSSHAKGGAGNFVPFVGYTYYKESAIQGHGFNARLAIVLPQTEFSYGPYVRYLSYPTSDRDTRRWSGGFRVDSGFSSFFTFFLALGRDYGTTPERSFGQGFMFTGGIAILLPTSLLPRRKPTD